jgi:hypothetical protein
MPFLNVALTSRISATMTVVGSSKFSRCVILSEEYGLVGQRNCATQSLVFFYAGEHVDLQIGYTEEKKLRNCIYGKKARLTRTKDASRLSSVCLTK